MIEFFVSLAEIKKEVGIARETVKTANEQIKNRYTKKRALETRVSKGNSKYIENALIDYTSQEFKKFEQLGLKPPTVRLRKGTNYGQVRKNIETLRKFLNSDLGKASTFKKMLDAGVPAKDINIKIFNKSNTVKDLARMKYIPKIYQESVAKRFRNVANARIRELEKAGYDVNQKYQPSLNNRGFFSKTEDEDMNTIRMYKDFILDKSSTLSEMSRSRKRTEDKLGRTLTNSEYNALLNKTRAVWAKYGDKLKILELDTNDIYKIIDMEKVTTEGIDEFIDRVYEKVTEEMEREMKRTEALEREFEEYKQKMGDIFED